MKIRFGRSVIIAAFALSSLSLPQIVKGGSGDYNSGNCEIAISSFQTRDCDPKNSNMAHWAGTGIGSKNMGSSKCGTYAVLNRDCASVTTNPPNE